MKTTIKISRILLLIYTLSSCKKDYTCTCEVTSNVPWRTPAYMKETNELTIHDKKKNAEATCTEREGDLGAGVYYSASCVFH